jgi:hypothetical protein
MNTKSEFSQSFKQRRIEDINALGIPDLQISGLSLLNSDYVNLAYPLPSGVAVQFLDDNAVYLGAQIERPGNERCYGVVTNEAFILVCEYGEGGSSPKLLRYIATDPVSAV